MEKLFEYLLDLSGGTSYLIVFGILVACGIGFPLPEDIPLIASGYLVWDGTMKGWATFCVTMAGVLLGDSALYFLGRNLGVRILESKAQTLFPPHKIRRTRAYFRKYGDKIVFFARFVAGFRAVAFFMAGSLRMKYRRFMFLDGVAALVSVPLWIMLGYGLGNYFGDEIGSILKNAKQFKTAFSGLIFLLVCGLVGRAYYKYRKAKESGARRRASLKKAPAKTHH